MKNKNLQTENNPKTQKSEIDILPLLGALFSKLWLILLAAVVVGVSTFVVARLTVKPTYRAGFSAYVNNTRAQTSKEYVSNSDILASHGLVQTYSRILTSHIVFDAASKEINKDLDYSDLAEMVSTQVQEDTEIIYVYVESEDKDLAFNLACALAKVSPAYMSDIIEGSSMKIIDYPTYPSARYKPSYVRYGFIGALVGALLVALYIAIRFYTDDTVKDEKDIEAQFSIPILGVIPDLTASRDKKSGYYSYHSYDSYEYSYGSAQNQSERSDKNEKNKKSE